MPNLDPARRHGQSTMAAWIVLATVAMAQTSMPENNRTTATSCEVGLECLRNERTLSVRCQFPLDITLPSSKLGFSLYHPPVYSDPTSKEVNVLACRWTNNGTIVQCTPNSGPYKLTTPSTDITDNVTFQVPINSIISNEFFCGMIEKGSVIRPELHCHIDIRALVSNETECLRSKTEVPEAGTKECSCNIYLAVTTSIFVIMLTGLLALLFWCSRMTKRFVNRKNDDPQDPKPKPYHLLEQVYMSESIEMRGQDSDHDCVTNESIYTEELRPAITSSQSNCSLLSNNTTPTRKADKPRSINFKTPKDACKMTIAQVCLAVPLAAAMLTCVSAVETTTSVIGPTANISCKVEMDTVKLSAFVYCHFAVDIRTEKRAFNLHTINQTTKLEELAAACEWRSSFGCVGETSYGQSADLNTTNTAIFSIPKSALNSTFFCQLAPEDIGITSLPCNFSNTNGGTSCNEVTTCKEGASWAVVNGLIALVVILAVIIIVGIILLICYRRRRCLFYGLPR